MKALSDKASIFTLAISAFLFSPEALLAKASVDEAAFSKDVKTTKLIKQAKLPCNINAQSKDYVACIDGEIFRIDKFFLKAKSGIKFIDNDQNNLLVLSYDKGESFIEIFDNFAKKLASFKVPISTLLAYLSDEKIILLDIANSLKILDFNQNVLYQQEFSSASLSAASINSKRDKIALGDEGGVIRIIDLNTHIVLSAFVHLDKINCLSLSDDFLISASTDRRAVLSDLNLKPIKTFKSDNLIYFCAADKSNWAYSCGFEEHICTSKNHILNVGNEYINSLLFRNGELIVNAYSPYILKEENDLISDN